MAECCEPGCKREVLCPVHEHEKRLREQVKEWRDTQQMIIDRNATYYDGHLDPASVPFDAEIAVLAFNKVLGLLGGDDE